MKVLFATSEFADYAKAGASATSLRLVDPWAAGRAALATGGGET